jgi:hypothetical protein
VDALHRENNPPQRAGLVAGTERRKLRRHFTDSGTVGLRGGLGMRSIAPASARLVHSAFDTGHGADRSR